MCGDLLSFGGEVAASQGVSGETDYLVIVTYSPLYKISVQVLRQKSTLENCKSPEASEDVLGNKLVAKTSDPTIKDKPLEVKMRPT